MLLVLREIWQELRKFGLEYCDLPTMVTNLNCLLRFLIINIDRRNKKSIPIFFYGIYFVSFAMFFYVYQFSTVWFVFVWSPGNRDLFCVITILSLGIGSTISVTKMIFMLLYQDRVRGIIDAYLALDALVIPRSRFANNLAKALRTVKRRAIIFWTVVMTNIAIYILLGVLKPGRHFLVDCFVFYGMEPIFESPNYEICLISNIIGVTVAGILPANITVFLITVTGYTEAQMLALSEELRLLWDDAQEHYAEKEQLENKPRKAFNDDDKTKKKFVNDYIRSNLVGIVICHTTNIHLLRQVEMLFRGAFVVEFLLVMFAVIAQLLGGLENTYMELPFALMMVAVDCLVGQRVMDAGEVFEYAVYDSKLENFDITNKKIVLLMLQNAQKTMVLSAGGVATLNYACFMNLLRAIYSAFTALRSTM